MRFIPTALDGVVIVEPEPAHDSRGFFARTFCVREFGAQGLETAFVQHSLSHSAARGTLRGMHFQRGPYAEVKVVTCTKGAVRDVLIDLRPRSPTYRRWEGYDLTAANRRSLYVPKGFAHGFQTLEPDTEVSYLISEFHAPAAATGVRHDDPAFGIAWPLPITEISEKDRNWRDFAEAVHT
ncbi:dTDP-4-dehydrorhamnose 3,5-epimerase [Roseomonas eburnea]|uniref:dTDP-4-dehydrorhamnose 3,5-epimerase n=1 Tax=Neoroseomonas eburnea TaxID=1346889 RepID=A0A9X9X5S9_9PROT|nr:dTDP-4-dehydrorhamnose 3,5-epimerase [Neoroseomonas eburnea]MBR0679065.1 dTDP-4-dehydrorhamnose 3,5-epimerase [Neoroseomonas eburnea]